MIVIRLRSCGYGNAFALLFQSSNFPLHLAGFGDKLARGSLTTALKPNLAN